MEKAWNIVKMIFASVDRGDLIRSYILGFLYMAIVVAPHTFMYWHRDTTWITLLLFPFAKLVWDGVMNTLIGNNVYIFPIWIIYLWKFTKYYILIKCIWFICPLGIAYLLFINREYIKQI